MNADYEYIPHGDMGKGGGSPTEDDDTVSSKQTLKVLFAVSNGPISSIDKIFINTARLSYDENTKRYSIKGVIPDYRLGYSVQNVIDGFSSIESILPSSSFALTNNNPVTRSFTGANVDSLRITFYHDRLLFVDKSGNVIKYKVDYTLYIYDISEPTETTVPATVRKVSTELNKSSGKWSFDVIVPKPETVTSESWAIKFHRETVDDDTKSVKPTNKASSSGGVMAITQIKNKELPYNGVALIALSFTKANRFNNTIPDLIFKVSGILVKVPYTYNKDTGKYSDGTWPLLVDGKPQYWASERLPSTNPAWQILYLLTDTYYGLGISETKIDLDAFYAFGKYCDEMLSPTSTVTRYSLSNQFTEREEASKFLSYFFGIANARPSINKYGLYSVVWDRKRAATHIITNSSVIDGIFEYSSNSLEQRYTSINVIYNNKYELGKTTVVSVPDSITNANELETSLFNRYGFRPIDIPLVGCYSREQAIRKGRWSLYRNSVLVNIVTFKMAFAAFTYEVGEIICIMDDMRCDVMAQGRLLAVENDAGIPDTLLNLDRVVTITTGNTLYYYSSTGLQHAIITMNDVESDVITISKLSETPIIGTPWMVVGSENPTYWEIVSLSFDQDSKTTTVQGVEYSDALYDYIDSGITDEIINNSTYSGIPEAAFSVSPPINLTVTQLPDVTDKSVSIEWDWFYDIDAKNAYEAHKAEAIPLTKDFVNKNYKATYTLYYSESGGNTEKTIVSNIDIQSYILTGLEDGIYDFSVIAISATGLESYPISLNSQIIINKDLYEFDIKTSSIPKDGYAFGYETIFKKFEIAYIRCNAKCTFSLRTMKEVDLAKLSELDRTNLTTVLDDVDVIGGVNYVKSSEINFQIEFENDEASAHRLVPPVVIKQFEPPTSALTDNAEALLIAAPPVAETYWTVYNTDTVSNTYTITLLCRKL